MNAADMNALPYPDYLTCEDAEIMLCLRPVAFNAWMAERDGREYAAMRSLFSAHPRDVRGGDLFRTPAQLLRERMEAQS